MKVLHSRQRRAGLLILLLGVAIAIAVSPFAVGLFGAGVLYVMFAGMHRKLRRGLPSSAAASITLIVAIVLVVVPLALIGGLVIEQAPETLKAVQSGDALARISALSVGTLRVGTEIAKASNAIVSWISAQAFSLVGNAALAGINLVISFFGLFYLLTSGTQAWVAVREYLPFRPKTSDELKDRFVSVTKATLLGTTLVALMQGTLVGVGFAVTGLPSPAFWGVVTAVASVLPVLGSALVWVPGMLVLVLQHQYGAAVVLAVIGGVVASNIDNLIRPMIYRRVSNIHPMITLIGVFAGVEYVGLLGVLIGPLAIAYFFEMLRLYQVEYGSLSATDSAA